MVWFVTAVENLQAMWRFYFNNFVCKSNFWSNYNRESPTIPVELRRGNCTSNHTWSLTEELGTGQNKVSRSVQVRVCRCFNGNSPTDPKDHKGGKEVCLWRCEGWCYFITFPNESWSVKSREEKHDKSNSNTDHKAAWILTQANQIWWKTNLSLWDNTWTNTEHIHNKTK